MGGIRGKRYIDENGNEVLTGGLKTAKTVYEKYGKDYYKNIGRKGGSVTGTMGGFAHKDNAKKFGKKGGTRSRRGYKLIERHESYGVYINLQSGEKQEFKW